MWYPYLFYIGLLCVVDSYNTNKYLALNGRNGDSFFIVYKVAPKDQISIFQNNILKIFIKYKIYDLLTEYF